MHMDMQKTQKSQNKFEKAEFGDLLLLNFRMHYQSTVINTV